MPHLRYLGKGVLTAVKNVNEVIAPKFFGKSVLEQATWTSWQIDPTNVSIDFGRSQEVSAFCVGCLPLHALNSFFGFDWNISGLLCADMPFSPEVKTQVLRYFLSLINFAHGCQLVTWHQLTIRHQGCPGTVIHDLLWLRNRSCDFAGRTGQDDVRGALC